MVIPVNPQEATPALRRLVGRAALISRLGKESNVFSFSVLLTAFLAGDDPLSRWFQRYVRWARVDVDSILGHKGLNRDLVDQVAQNESPPEDIDPSSLGSVTSSAEGIFTQAQKLLEIVSRPKGHSLLDVRHLMGAYIYHPVGHEDQLKGWNFDPEAWSNAFLAEMEARHPDEFELWMKEHLARFSQTPQPVAVPVEGLTTYIAGDRWTLDDALGYDAYAYAIYRFLTHPETRPPLTISIQAPWGGGKTSLMRMIQKRLDPLALRSYQQRTAADLEEEQEQDGTGKSTVGDVQAELDKLAQGRQPQFEIAQVEAERMQRLTVWFNVWKYESTEQVWAGLADAVIRQFAARLGPLEREKFWLHLHLRRLDSDQIRRAIYDRLWRRLLPWLTGAVSVFIASAVAAVFGWTADNLFLQVPGLAGVVLSILGGLYAIDEQVRAVNAEPAEFSLGEYVRAPDYSASLGFVHHVEEDLQRVFEVIQEPMVIFIDDLDRCSPDKVADVVEGINLFLAGEFQNCMFVLGMDPEMVAAALEEAHSKVIAKLPADATSTPLGWRFMDKFVQLPFFIPPAEDGDLRNYATSLLSGGEGNGRVDERVLAVAGDALPVADEPAAIEQQAQTLAQEHDLSEAQRSELARLLVHQSTYRLMDRGIDSFSDTDSEIRGLVLKTAPEFSSNPRELKRFFNLFRFLFFLKWAREGRGQPSPTNEQLRRWIVLSMKWPQVVRWMRRSYGGREAEAQAGAANSTPALRLRQLENLGAATGNLAEWRVQAKDDLHLEAGQTPWIADEDLMAFFQREGRLEQNLRLSAAAGMGLW
ncbi:MAG: P-loop NTPase fold protein [Anaerolineae bacterium]